MIEVKDMERLFAEQRATPFDPQEWLGVIELSEDAFHWIIEKIADAFRINLLAVAAAKQAGEDYAGIGAEIIQDVNVWEVTVSSAVASAFRFGWLVAEQYGKERTVVQGGSSD